MIEIQDLSKKYRKKNVLSGINLKIPYGVFGIIGNPKTGKSTLLKILATLETPTKGDIHILDHNIKIQKEIIKSYTGFLPQEFDFFSSLTVKEALSCLFDLKCNNKKFTKSQKNTDIGDCLTYVNLIAEADTKIEKLTPDMLKKLGIAQAFLCDPKIVILDEPTMGLEAHDQKRFLKLLSKIKDDRIVIMATRNIKDIRTACNNFAVLDNGSVTYSGNLESYASSLQKEVYTIAIKKDMLLSFVKNVNVIALAPAENKIIVRYMNITDDKIKINNISTQVSPTITDAYAYYNKSWITEERLLQ